MSENATTRIRKYLYSTLILAAIGLDNKSKLIFIDKSVNQYRYKKLLQDSKIFSELDRKKNQWNYIFQQDGATCHLTPIVIRYINRKARFLKGWPPNSLDLSPIENLQGIMKERLNRLTTKLKDKNELKKLIQQVYDSISIEYF